MTRALSSKSSGTNSRERLMLQSSESWCWWDYSDIEEAKYQNYSNWRLLASKPKKYLEHHHDEVITDLSVKIESIEWSWDKWRTRGTRGWRLYWRIRCYWIWYGGPWARLLAISVLGVTFHDDRDLSERLDIAWIRADWTIIGINSRNERNFPFSR